MIFPTFSFLPTPSRIFPSTNPSLCQTSTGTYPHLSPTSRALRTRPHSILRCAFRVSPFSVLICSTLPPALRSIVSFFLSRMFSPFVSAATPHPLCSTDPLFHFLSRIVPLSISFSHWLSDVEAYPESYLEPQFSLHLVLYKVSRPLVCSLASSTQSSLVSSLPRFTLRPNLLEAFPHPEWLS